MAACLVCGVEVRLGTLCRDHALALATCDDITAEQIVSAGHDEPEARVPEAWLIDQWGCTHAIVSPAEIGRSTTGCSVGVLHPSVSLLHAELRGGGDVWTVADRGSLNGTHVNDAQVRSTEIRSGDRLRVGDVSFYFSAGRLASVEEPKTTGRTMPSKLDELSLEATLELDGDAIELVERPGGGIIRRGDEVALELARLEFGLLAELVKEKSEQSDPERAFVSSRDLAGRLEFNARRADGENVRELVRRVRKKAEAAGIADFIESRQRVGYRIAWEIVRTGRVSR